MCNLLRVDHRNESVKFELDDKSMYTKYNSNIKFISNLYFE